MFTVVVERIVIIIVLGIFINGCAIKDGMNM